ncbi:hypothetical protein ACWECC_18870 [Streptomyces microflavus]
MDDAFVPAGQLAREQGFLYEGKELQVMQPPFLSAGHVTLTVWDVNNPTGRDFELTLPMSEKVKRTDT